jgi:hypothetical protein
MRQRFAGDGHAEIGHVGKIRQPHAAVRMLLTEHHLALRPVHRSPGPDAPLQGSAQAWAQLRMSAQQLVKNGDRTQSRRGLQHCHDFAFPDIGEGIGPPTTAPRLPLRGEPRILVEPIGGGGTEAGLGAGDGSRVRFSKLHEEPQLTIDDMGAGQKDRSSPEGKPDPSPARRDRQTPHF